MDKPASILITGASSGIGEALARLYAAPGVRLALSGRDETRLAAVVEACRAQGAEAEGRAVDVTDRAAMRAWIDALDRARPLDLVIANAGVAGPTTGTEDREERIRDIFAVNLAGTLNTVLPIVPAMKARRRGQIALMSSLAAFRGSPSAPAYAASKAAVKAWGEGLRGVLADHGVVVSVILPGFVTSRITAKNRFPMPFLMDAPRAARIIARGLAANRGRIAFPWPTHFLVWLTAALPDRLAEAIFRRLPRKED